VRGGRRRQPAAALSPARLWLPRLHLPRAGRAGRLRTPAQLHRLGQHGGRLLRAGACVVGRGCKGARGGGVAGVLPCPVPPGPVPPSPTPRLHCRCRWGPLLGARAELRCPRQPPHHVPAAAELPPPPAPPRLLQFELNGGRPVASSIPATEHSVMTSWPDERAAIENMIEHFGTGVFACVMDSYDYAAALAEVGRLGRRPEQPAGSCRGGPGGPGGGPWQPSAGCSGRGVGGAAGAMGAYRGCGALSAVPSTTASCCWTLLPPRRCCRPSPRRRLALAATWCCAPTQATPWRQC
jgi:hypothetical protein